ncbi:MAG: SpoIVB peptidase S55 domain-containing protein [Bacilli bacterium]
MTKLMILASIFLSSNISGVKPVEVYIGGNNIVFELNDQGITVTGGYDIKYNDNKYNPVSCGDIKVGDVIVGVNGDKIEGINDFVQKISLYDKEITLNIENGIDRMIHISKENGIVKTGLYVKDKTLGSGTLTFIDPHTSYYAALGHPVFNYEKKKKVDFISGSIYETSVEGIKKGTNGNPGEKITSTKLDNKIGDVTNNDAMGLFGKYNRNILDNNQKYEICPKKDIKLGKAYIYTVTNGFEREKYQIQITKLHSQDENEQKGIEFEITDKNLLAVAGGIYSGMSGSPIIQDNRIIGAVTHVKVDNIKQGFGLYAMNMYQRLSSFTN